VIEREAAEVALLASDADETAEGRSIVTLMQEKYNVKRQVAPAGAKFIEFSAMTRLSGVDIGARKVRKGAIDSVLEFARQQAGRDVTNVIDRYESCVLPGSTVDSISQIERLEAINLGFSHVQSKSVLQDFNVSLDKGKSYAFVGLSGSGKSTFLEALRCVLGDYATTADFGASLTSKGVTSSCLCK
jgi:ABC-type multidrug transport system fused ATPase/permease subunit